MTPMGQGNGHPHWLVHVREDYPEGYASVLVDAAMSGVDDAVETALAVARRVGIDPEQLESDSRITVTIL